MYTQTMLAHAARGPLLRRKRLGSMLICKHWYVLELLTRFCGKHTEERPAGCKYTHTILAHATRVSLHVCDQEQVVERRFLGMQHLALRLEF